MRQSRIYTKVSEIREILGLSLEESKQMEKITERYPMAVTDYYLSLIDPSDPGDPIRRMCIPSVAEESQEGTFDTSGEEDNTVAVGLQHKYDATALILSTNRCAMYCRHCFRKRMVGAAESEIMRNFQEAQTYIREHKEISNVLISGGDSLMMSNEMIEKYLEAFAGMEHLDLIRLGTRVPVVFPDRVRQDEKLQEIFGRYAGKKQIYIVTQFNHPRELTEEARDCVRIFRELGMVVRNQTVLLKGVNDEPAVMGDLLKKLTAAGVVPYYIFQCRPVKGVKARFQVPLKDGARIVDEAKNMQNGQGKGLRYCMSLPRGKAEILGMLPGSEDEMLFKFHQAREKEDQARIFTVKLDPGQAWLTI